LRSRDPHCRKATWIVKKRQHDGDKSNLTSNPESL
jgi:hypothetical protein